MRRSSWIATAVGVGIGIGYGHYARLHGSPGGAGAHLARALDDSRPVAYGLLLPLLVLSQAEAAFALSPSALARFGSRHRLLAGLAMGRLQLAGAAVVGLLVGVLSSAVGLGLHDGPVAADLVRGLTPADLSPWALAGLHALTAVLGLTALLTLGAVTLLWGVPAWGAVAGLWLLVVLNIAGVVPLPIASVYHLGDQVRLMGLPLIAVVALALLVWGMTRRHGWRVRAGALGLWLGHLWVTQAVAAPDVDGATSAALEVLDGPGRVSLLGYLTLALVTGAPLLAWALDTDGGLSNIAQARALRRGSGTRETVATVLGILRESLAIQTAALLLLLVILVTRGAHLGADVTLQRQWAWWLVGPAANLAALAPLMVTLALRRRMGRAAIIWAGLWVGAPLVLSRLAWGGLFGALDLATSHHLGLALAAPAVLCTTSFVVLAIRERRHLWTAG